LYSDGNLEVASQTELLAEDSKIILNVKTVKSIDYHSGKHKNRIAYQFAGLISLISTFMHLASIENSFNAIFEGFDISTTDIVLSSSIIIFIMFDLYRHKLADPQMVIFKTENEEPKQIVGDLPDSIIHDFSVLIVLFNLFLFGLFTLEWGVERVPPIGDFLSTVLGILILYFILNSLYKHFTKDIELGGIDSSEIPNGLLHLYFASMAMYGNNSSTTKIQQDVNEELKEIKEKLKQHDQIISDIISANDIFSASSPSMGVIAVRVSTEALMKNACDIVGAKFPSNARPTLYSYLQKYRSLVKMDSKIESYINNVINLGNRAAHDFNLDLDEFHLIVNQFVEIVSWYSETHMSDEES
jgi:hypothetical protein